MFADVGTDELRRRLAAILQPAGGELIGDDVAGSAHLAGAAVRAGGAAIAASVLVPIVLRQPAPTLLLTRRSEHLRDHPGQISFPGGRVEPCDTSPAHTALREATEEIGLDAAHVEVLGFLPDYLTVTGFRITPVVALLTPPFKLAADAFEVAEIFEVPLGFVLDPNNHQRHAYTLRGRSGHYRAIPWGDYNIWGATAGMICDLSTRLADAPVKAAAHAAGKP
ncbi:CoA pyrophosphatase [Rhodocyclus tenuis]|uniref:CoA pyrophosphatase n=1 Tax=Rhodocyclus tenuis TaxID=1066 RepID=UPI00190810F7|nr:CoA pyrophosphatase [Rhodocyclus tenuis]MBK1679455.1 CoA pyrophosphatase [Rhodocyclus tenuis]